MAVKILAEHLSDDDKFVARFRREALAVAKLIHPNIVQVYDTGVDHDRHYIVMEYVEGRSGAQLLQARGPLGPEIAVEVGAQACAGLEYAHRQGIIHRDVKPGNLMVIGGPARRAQPGATAHDPPTGEMTVKLTDFGIARAAEQTPADAGGLGGRHRRLPGARAGPRRGGDARLRRLRAGRGHLPAPDRAPAVGGNDPVRARDPPRERAAVAAQLLRPRGARRPCRRRCCARWRATPRCATRPPASSRSRCGPGSPVRSRRGRRPRRRRGRWPATRTGATRRLAPSEPATPAGRRRPPRPAPARRPRPAVQPAERRPRRSLASRLGSAIGILLVIALLAAVIAGVVLLTTERRPEHRPDQAHRSPIRSSRSRTSSTPTRSEPSRGARRSATSRHGGAPSRVARR